MERLRPLTKFSACMTFISSFTDGVHKTPVSFPTDHWFMYDDTHRI